MHDGVVARLGDAELCLETDEVLAVGVKKLGELLSGVSLRETVRVIAIRQSDDTYVESVLKQHINASHGGMDASGIAVVHDSDVGGESFELSYLVGGE